MKCHESMVIKNAHFCNHELKNVTAFVRRGKNGMKERESCSDKQMSGNEET